jgi:bacillolysin/thermolysin
MRLTKLLIFSFCILLLYFGLSFGWSKRKPIQKTKQTEEKMKLIDARDSTLSKLKADIESEVEVRYDDNGVPTFLKGKLSKQAGEHKVEFALNFFHEYNGLFLLQEPKEELKLKSEKMDKAGNIHLRFDQYYEGIPVWGAELLLHYDKDGFIKLINGRWEPTPQVDIIPSISQDEALQIAKDELGKQDSWLKDPTSVLHIFTWEGETHLAWQVTLIPDMAHIWIYFTDAKSGDILLKYNDVKFDGPVSADGVLVNGNTVSLNAYDIGGTIYLIDVTKPMYTPPWEGIIDTWNAYNDEDDSNDSLVYDPNGDKHFNDAQHLKASVSAHYYVGKVYDYFYNTFARDSWDDNGGRISNVVHYGTNYNNAFWNGVWMVFGDGDGINYLPFSGALDITAHELGHAITQETAGLIYLGEWGALNEHFSDVWGAMLDSGDWLIGEDITLTYPWYLRDMANPHFSSPWQPAHVSEYLYWPGDTIELHDNGGVHYNMGIPNKACYLLATSQNRDVTAWLYYWSLVNYLFPKARFVDLRRSMLQVAEDFYSGDPNYVYLVSCIKNAFDQVGIVDYYSIGTDTLAYDDGYAAYYYYIGPGAYYNRHAVRFTPHAPCSLKAVSTQFYSYGSNSWLHVWADSQYYGIPGREKLSLNVNRTTQFPNWQTIDLSSYGLHFDSDFYIGFSSNTLDSFWISDSLLNHLTVYVDTGEWCLNEDFWGDPLLRAIVKYDQVTDVAEEEQILLPTPFVLHQNCPNPFNSSTRIDYSLSFPTEVRISVFNILGQKVKMLVDEFQTRGYKTVLWDGTDKSGAQVSSGIYFCKLQAGKFSESKKIVLLK